MNELITRISPYNLWNGNRLPVGFERSEYTARLERLSGNRLVKILTGQRRAGKSFIMRQLAMKLVDSGVKCENILFINKELSVFDFIQNSDDLTRLVTIFREEVAKEGRIYIFIDEVQDITNWETAVNSLSQDYAFENEIFLSGSNSRLLSGELTTLLSGRYVEMEVFPFSFSEYCGFYNLERGRESFLKYLNDGGLPELVNLNGTDVKQRYVEGLRDSILLKDIGLLDNLYSYLVNTASNIISITSMVNYMKSRGSRTTYDTISSYLQYFQEAFILHKSVRFNISGKELLGGSFKIYPNDQAYHNYLFPTISYGRGYILEGIVFLTLLRKGYKVNTGVLNKGEIDFVASSDKGTFYIQVAYSIEDYSTAERQYGAFKGIKGEGERLIITVDDAHFPPRDGVRHIQAWNLEEML